MSNFHAVYQEQVRKYVDTQYATIMPPGKKAGMSQPMAMNNSSTVSSEMQQPTVKSLFTSSAPLTPGNKHHEAITDAITYFHCKDNIPFNTVSRPGFKKLLTVLEPRHNVPNKTTFAKNIAVELYDATKEAVRPGLNSVDFFTSTSDMWSSHGLAPYMGYTLHWIDLEWILQCRNLGTKFVPEDHTAKQLGKTMKHILMHWELDTKKQIAITMDNGTNITKACRDMEWINIPSFGHNLHLAITKTLNHILRIGLCIKYLQEDHGSIWVKLEKKRSYHHSSPARTGTKI